MKTASILALVLTAVWVILALLQLWFELFAGGVFFKITVTFATITGLIVLVALVHREYIREQSLKARGFID